MYVNQISSSRPHCHMVLLCISFYFVGSLKKLYFSSQPLWLPEYNHTYSGLLHQHVTTLSSLIFNSTITYKIDFQCPIDAQTTKTAAIHIMPMLNWPLSHYFKSLTCLRPSQNVCLLYKTANPTFNFHFVCFLCKTTNPTFNSHFVCLLCKTTDPTFNFHDVRLLCKTTDPTFCFHYVSHLCKTTDPTFYFHCVSHLCKTTDTLTISLI